MRVWRWFLRVLGRLIVFLAGDGGPRPPYEGE